MANIINVDYEAIPRQAASMRANGKEINAELSAAFSSIDGMRSAWYGQRYNALVQQFNRIVPGVNELLELVVDQIPYTLETVANNYSMADRGANVAKAIKENPNKIVEITIKNDVGLRFIEGEVVTVQQKVTKNFQNASERMNAIEAEYSKISWQSEAADAFKTRFTKLKNDIINEFSNLNSQFTNLMNQTKEDIQKTENSNTVQ